MAGAAANAVSLLPILLLLVLVPQLLGVSIHTHAPVIHGAPSQHLPRLRSSICMGTEQSDALVMSWSHRLRIMLCQVPCDKKVSALSFPL